jgi:hypothetical protein
MNLVKFLDNCKSFSEYIYGNFEVRIGADDVLSLIFNRTDWQQYKPAEKKTAICEWIKKGYIYIDSEIYITFKLKI